jgi:hypothetical protein
MASFQSGKVVFDVTSSCSLVVRYDVYCHLYLTRGLLVPYAERLDYYQVHLIYRSNYVVRCPRICDWMCDEPTVVTILQLHCL